MPLSTQKHCWYCRRAPYRIYNWTAPHLHTMPRKRAADSVESSPSKTKAARAGAGGPAFSFPYPGVLVSMSSMSTGVH